MIMDLRTARIDNGWILFSMAVGAVCCTMEKGIAGMFFYAAGSSIPLILIILFGFGMLGAGDIKLFCALGGVMGTAGILKCILGFLYSGIIHFSSDLNVQPQVSAKESSTSFAISGRLSGKESNTLPQERHICFGEFSFHRSDLSECCVICGRCLLKEIEENIFAVCDLEVDYALNFMDYLNQKKNIPFEIQVFTAVENLIAYGKKTRIELLLISGRAMCREVRELDIGKIIILSEGVHSPELDTYPSVYKYQSSSDVIREVMECYGAEKKTVPGQYTVLKKTTEMLGVFSPLGRCLKTSFALTLGQILAKERAVLI